MLKNKGTFLFNGTACIILALIKLVFFYLIHLMRVTLVAINRIISGMQTKLL